VQRNWYEALPTEHRSAIDELYNQSRHLSWTEITEQVHGYLGSNGLTVTLGRLPARSSVYRVLSKYEEWIDRYKMTSGFVESSLEKVGDSEDKRGELNAAILAQNLFEAQMLLNPEELDSFEDKLKFIKAQRDIADALGRYTRAQKDREDFRAKVRTVADAVTEAARTGGLSEEVIRRIEQEVLGLG
jgi:hypothetical protein